MASKKKTKFPLADDYGEDFSKEDEILNFRPHIDFVQPEPELGDEGSVAAAPAVTSIDDSKNRARDLINGFNSVNKLADLAQQRLDDRIKTLGGLNIHLDPVHDSHVIAAMQRHFPNEDPNRISYEQYKKALDCINKLSPFDPNKLTTTEQAIIDAAQDPLRTNFGGWGSTPGLNRPEISSAMQSIQPIDLIEFQKNAILSLFDMLKPLITDLVKSLVPGI